MVWLFYVPPSQWKEIFEERYRLWRNWSCGYCNIRTFEGHTQGGRGTELRVGWREGEEKQARLSGLIPAYWPVGKEWLFAQ